jgi:hypothetical protein
MNRLTNLQKWGSTGSCRNYTLTFSCQDSFLEGSPPDRFMSGEPGAQPSQYSKL